MVAAIVGPGVVPSDELWTLVRSSGTSTVGIGDPLEFVVAGLAYKPGWQFFLARTAGSWRQLRIDARVYNSHRPVHPEFLVIHMIDVPPVPYTVEEWERWVLDQIIRVETHEACEFFTVHGVRPFYPWHATDYPPGEIVDGDGYACKRRDDPYVVRRREP